MRSDGREQPLSFSLTRWFLLGNWRETQRLTNSLTSSAASYWPQTPSFIELTLRLS